MPNIRFRSLFFLPKTKTLWDVMFPDFPVEVYKLFLWCITYLRAKISIVANQLFSAVLKGI